MEIPLLTGRTGWRKKASCNTRISSSSSGPLVGSTPASARKDGRRLVAHCSASINRWDQDAHITVCCPGLNRRLWRTANGKKLTTAWRSKQHCRYSVSLFIRLRKLETKILNNPTISFIYFIGCNESLPKKIVYLNFRAYKKDVSRFFACYLVLNRIQYRFNFAVHLYSVVSYNS